jgi:hypothetical protein
MKTVWNILYRILFTTLAVAGLVFVGLKLGSESQTQALGAFLVIVLCVMIIAISVAPLLARFAARSIVDFVFSAQWTTAETDINDSTLYRQSQEVFSLLRTISFLVLAAALYGIFWSVPILRQWSSLDDLAPIPNHLVAALVVGIASALVWSFYLGVYFIPTVYHRVQTVWWHWRYGEEEPIPPAPDPNDFPEIPPPDNPPTDPSDRK